MDSIVKATAAAAVPAVPLQLADASEFPALGVVAVARRGGRVGDDSPTTPTTAPGSPLTVTISPTVVAASHRP